MRRSKAHPTSSAPNVPLSEGKEVACKNIADEDWQFTYLNINTPQTINGQNFAETITVERTNNDENLVEKKLYKEVYAKGIGSVYKEEWVLNLGGNDITNPQPWPQRAERGYTTTSKILSYCLQDCD